MKNKTILAFTFILVISIVLSALVGFTVSASINGTLSQQEKKFDVNEDGKVNISDVTYLLDYLGGSLSNSEEEYSLPTFVVSKVSAQAGASEVQVPIELKKNPGISSIALDVGYGEGLILKSVQFNTTVFQGQTITSEPLGNPAFVSWVSMTDVNDDAVFVTLVFEVSSSASGTIGISISYDEDNVYNYNEDNVSFEISNGSITVQ